MIRGTKVILSWLVVLEGCALFRDPRASCNHPQHEDYVRQQQEKRLAKQTRTRGKSIGKRARPLPKSCPNS